MQHNIMLIDDSEETFHCVAHSLSTLFVNLIFCQSLKDALSKMNNFAIDLFIVDICLPDGNGLSLVDSIRADAKFHLSPVLILSSDGHVPTKLSAFSLGADDYIVKPFNNLELRARVESKLKRLVKADGNSLPLVIGEFLVNQNQQSVQLKSTGELIQLTPIEFRLLVLLGRRKGDIFSRQRILDEIWGHGTFVNERTVDTHIYSLRRKLKELGTIIEAVQGEGYRVSERPNDMVSPQI